MENEFQLRMLKVILDFTKVHFDAEEKLMHEYGYPDSARYRRMHKDFDQQVYDNYRQVMKGEMVLKSELLALLRNWFLNHTGGEDEKTFQHIHAEKAKRK